MKKEMIWSSMAAYHTKVVSLQISAYAGTRIHATHYPHEQTHPLRESAFIGPRHLTTYTGESFTPLKGSACYYLLYCYIAISRIADCASFIMQRQPRGYQFVRADCDWLGRPEKMVAASDSSGLALLWTGFDWTGFE